MPPLPVELNYNLVAIDEHSQSRREPSYSICCNMLKNGIINAHYSVLAGIILCSHAAYDDIRNPISSANLHRSESHLAIRFLQSIEEFVVFQRASNIEVYATIYL